MVKGESPRGRADKGLVRRVFWTQLSCLLWACLVCDAHWTSEMLSSPVAW